MAEDAYTKLLEKLPEIAEAVKAFDSPVLQERVFETLAKSLGAQVGGAPSDGGGGGDGGGRGRPRRTNRRPAATEKDGNGGEKSSRSRRPATMAEKGLDLRPAGAPPFVEFAKAKGPGTLQERNVVAVFYLKEHMNLEKVGVGHVLAAFREAGWKPATQRKRCGRPRTPGAGSIHRIRATSA